MRYLSVCSGIEAATQAWSPLGWQPVAFSEIEPFPCAVLAHHYPDVPNWGDMTKFKEWPDEPIDLLCGGTPCQSFSVAGLRRGLADPRGNLTLTFLGIVEKYRPRYVVWENVPGVISSKDNALGQFMEGLNELGYAVECDILDAQYFGLAQRRRRVFLVCHNIADGREKKTPLFANAAGQFLSEMLLSALAEVSDPLNIGAACSEWPVRFTRLGLNPKMNCFGVPLSLRGDVHGLTAWLENFLRDWGVALMQLGGGHESLASNCEKASDREAGSIQVEELSGSMDRPQYSNTEPSWKSISGVLCGLMSMSTTSTVTRTITTSEIYTCAQASLSIVQSIIKSTTSPANYFDGDGSGLTALKAFTKYARQAASDLFGNIDGLCDWDGFIAEAERAIRKLERSLGDRANTGSLYANSEGLRGYSPPRREAGQAAPTIPSRSTGGGGLGTDFDCDGGLIPAASMCLNAGAMGRIDGESETFIPVAIQERAVCENPNAGPDGAGYREDGASYTLEARSTTQAVSFQPGNIKRGCGSAPSSEVFPTLAANHGRGLSDQDPHVATPWAVRRLTPEECEALQGFPRGFTRIPYRNKPADKCPDGPRYKALGNSMAANCMDWLGDRIARVEAMSSPAMQAAE